MNNPKSTVSSGAFLYKTHPCTYADLFLGSRLGKSHIGCRCELLLGQAGYRRETSQARRGGVKTVGKARLSVLNCLNAGVFPLLMVVTRNLWSREAKD